MHLEDIDTPLQIRLIDNNTPVKAPWPQQCLVENFRSVGRGKDDNALFAVKSIHLRKQLVQCLLTLFISAAIFGITASSDCVNLINKNNTRRILLCFLEQVTHTRCTDTDIQLNKIRTRKGEKWHLCLAGNRFCQHRLTSTGRSDKKRTLRKLCTNFYISARIVQKIDNLLQGFLRLVLPRNIAERDACLFLHIDLRVALAHAESPAACHFPEQQAQKPPHQKYRHDIIQKGKDNA